MIINPDTGKPYGPKRSGDDRRRCMHLRDVDIVQRKSQGESLRTIANIYSISRSRVEQIIKEMTKRGDV